jgi:hypothetical protein
VKAGALSIVLVTGVVATACATGGITPTTCQIEMAGPVEVDRVDGGADVEVLVQGRAGTQAVTWLAARRPAGDYVSGPGVDVGPGPFKAIVELSLTASAASYSVVLELADGRRCRDDS